MIRTIVFFLFFFFFVMQASAQRDSAQFPLVIDEIRKSIEKDTQSKFDTVTIITKKVLNKEAMSRPNTPAIKKKVTKKKLSIGEQKVAAMLAANRARVKSLQKKNKKAIPSKSSSWIENKRSKESEWLDNSNNAINSWRSDRAKNLMRWAADRARFKKDLPQYKKALTKIPVVEDKDFVEEKVKPKKQILKWINIQERQEKKAQINFMAASFDQGLGIRDQGRRPTCAAFAAVRAVEMKARSMGKPRDLSEQYFYFASKPECQSSPCSSAGSWPRRAFIASKQSVYPDIPLEKDCPYKGSKEVGNDTQIPLVSSCKKGAAKIKNFSKVKRRREIQDKIRQGHPVIGGFKLSKNFYENSGYVFKEENLTLGKDSHAKGHALLLVGVMELPAKLHASQGRFCTIVANSWGEGWGKGGHACLSDAWFDQFRYKTSFLAVEEVSVL